MVEQGNLILMLLREMRADMDRRFEDMTSRFGELNARFDSIDQRFDAAESRLDAMHQNGIKALKGFIGHRAMVERSMTSFDIDMSELKRRVDSLEAARS